MSYLVLARKYRPRDFGALVGQEHVVQALANALTQQRLHHAYLFTGTRGVGKTTISRILAKALNCTGIDGQGGITARPCGVCEACRDIDGGRFVDYVELDAASNRGVEEISQLLDQSVYKPVVGRFKVYMIDEVHMLSNTAFNAMLKTLEEPPDYLKFVLATTDPQKVPPTVLSRCLQFNLRPMAAATVQSHLAEVLEAEAVPSDVGALRLLARAARGSMRDALSLTDQAIAYGNGTLQEASVRQMLGAVDRRHASRLLDRLAAGDGAGLVAAADALRAVGLSATGTLEEMSELLQQAAVVQVVPDAIDPGEPEPAALRRVATLFDADTLQLLYSICLHGRTELALAPDEHSGLVMVLLRMLAFQPGRRMEPAMPPLVESERPTAPQRGPVAVGTAPVPLATVAVSTGLAQPLPAPAPSSATPAPWDDEPADAAPERVPAGSRPPAARAAPLLVSRPAQVSVAAPEPVLERAPTTRTSTDAPDGRPVPGAPADLGRGHGFDAAQDEAPNAGDEPPPWLDVPDEPGLSRSRGPSGSARDPSAEPVQQAASAARRSTPARAPSRPTAAAAAPASTEVATPPHPEPAAETESAPSLRAAADAPAQNRAAHDAPVVAATPEGDRWNEVVVTMAGAGRIGALVRELAMQAECLQVDETSAPVQWRLRVERESLRSPAQCEKLQKALADHLGCAVALQIEAGVARDSPARRAVAERDRRQREAERVIETDPVVQQLLREFRTARIVPGSIQPR